MYDPAVGIFLSTDPADVFWNPYRYTDNPINFIDPDGEHPIYWIVAGALVLWKAIEFSIHHNDASKKGDELKEASEEYEAAYAEYDGTEKAYERLERAHERLREAWKAAGSASGKVAKDLFLPTGIPTSAADVIVGEGVGRVIDAIDEAGRKSSDKDDKE